MGTAAAAEEVEVDALYLVTGDILLLTIEQKPNAENEYFYTNQQCTHFYYTLN